MDPVSMIVMALATGAVAALHDTAEQTVKDAYAGLTGLIRRNYSHVDIAVLEDKPTSASRRAVVKEELEQTEAGTDEEVLRQVKPLLDVIRTSAPEAAEAVGVSLEDIRGAALRLEDIVASGAGVVVKHATMTGDITIKGVRAGSRGDAANP